MELTHLILPDCILILLGWLLRNKWKFTAEFFAGLEKLVYYFLFPALMIRSLNTTPISFGKASDLFFICLLLAFIGLAISFFIKFFATTDPKSLASSSQCGYRFNTYVGLSLAPAIAGADSLAIMAILVGFSVPIVNILAVNSMAKHQSHNPLIEIIKNPLVISTLIGLAINFSGIPLPHIVISTLEKLSRSTIPLGLICVGAALIVRSGTQNTTLLSWMLTTRLALMPLVGILLSFLFGISPVNAQTVVLFTALPSASAAYILAVRMGGDGRLVASIISIGTILAMFTIPFWMFMAKWLFPV